MFCFSGQKLYQFLKGWFLFFLILVTFYLFGNNFGNNVKAAQVSEFVPKPEITSFVNNETLTGDIEIKGTSINYSQVKVYLGNDFIGLTKNKIGPQGWQDFEFKLSDNPVFGQHQLDLVAEYFNNTQSATTTLNFHYQAKFPSPTLFNPVLNNSTNFQQPYIVGLAFNNSNLEIYIDDQLTSKLLVENNPSGVASFKYLPYKKLSPGFHFVQVRAISPDNRISPFSNQIIFEIRLIKLIMSAPDLPQDQGKFIPPVPAPSLIEPKNRSVVSAVKNNKLIVSGLVHNEHYVKIFVDDELAGEFMPSPHPSGVTDFVWQHEKFLDAGFHKVWSKDINPQGQTSGQSNILRFIILPTEQVFVIQQQGKIAAVSEEHPAADISEGDEEYLVKDKEDQIIEKINGKINGIKEKISQYKWWKYIIGIGVLVMIILVIILITLRGKKKKKSDNEEIKVKVNGSEEIRNKKVVPNQAEELEIKKDGDEFSSPPPPPPADSLTLGI